MDKSPENWKGPNSGNTPQNKTPFFWRLPKLSPSQLGNFSPIKSVDINSGGPRGQYWMLCWRKMHNTHESRQNCHRMVSKGSKFCSKVRYLKEFELGEGRGRLASPCRWLCWWQGKAATLAQRNPLLMHQQSMYNVHTFTHLPGAMAMCQFKLHIRDNFFSRTLCSKFDFLVLWLNLHQLSPTCFSA